MIDMRTDSGEVQHDGFEYNWMFRKHHWRAEVGACSRGGWVRRRRWIRLMVRFGPGKRHEANEPQNLLSPNTPTLSNRTTRHSIASLPASSLLTSSSNSTSSRWKGLNPDDVWLGDSVEGDWERCHRFMKHFGRDGRKLELWRLWLGYYHPEYRDQFTIMDDKGKRREKQWTEDEGPLPSEMADLELFSNQTVAIAPREYLVPVLRKHVSS